MTEWILVMYVLSSCGMNLTYIPQPTEDICIAQGEQRLEREQAAVEFRCDPSRPNLETALAVIN